MFNLGTIGSFQVIDLLLFAVVVVASIAFIIATRNWSGREWDDEWKRPMSRTGKHARGDEDERK